MAVKTESLFVCPKRPCRVALDNRLASRPVTKGGDERGRGPGTGRTRGAIEVAHDAPQPRRAKAQRNVPGFRGRSAGFSATFATRAGAFSARWRGGLVASPVFTNGMPCLLLQELSKWRRSFIDVSVDSLCDCIDLDIPVCEVPVSQIGLFWTGSPKVTRPMSASEREPRASARKSLGGAVFRRMAKNCAPCGSLRRLKPAATETKLSLKRAGSLPPAGRPPSWVPAAAGLGAECSAR
jgi:hypothetical protein